MTESRFSDKTIDSDEGSELPSNVRRREEEDAPISFEDVVAINFVDWPGVPDVVCVIMLLLFLLGLFLFLFLPMVSMRRCRVMMQ